VSVVEKNFFMQARNLSPNPARNPAWPRLTTLGHSQKLTGATQYSLKGGQLRSRQLPPDHLQSEISFSRTCNISKHWKSTKTWRSYL